MSLHVGYRWTVVSFSICQTHIISPFKCVQKKKNEWFLNSYFFPLNIFHFSIDYFCFLYKSKKYWYSMVLPNIIKSWIAQDCTIARTLHAALGNSTNTCSTLLHNSKKLSIVKYCPIARNLLLHNSTVLHNITVLGNCKKSSIKN